MTINHTDLVAAIRAILVANTTPAFSEVFGGPISGLPLGGPYANFRYQGRGNSQSEYPQTVAGQLNITERWEITLFFVYMPERTVLEAFDIALADADQATQTAFRADAALNGKSSPTLTITDSEILDGLRFPLAGGEALYSGIRYQLLVKDVEAEGTTP